MQRQRIYYQVIPVADGMKKFARITNVIGGLATQGRLFIGPEHNVFMSQFESYGPTYGGNDDDLDASALALQELSQPYLEHLSEGGGSLTSDDGVEAFAFRGASP